MNHESSDMRTILKNYIIDIITITHFFLIIDTTTITLQKNHSRGK